LAREDFAAVFFLASADALALAVEAAVVFMAALGTVRACRLAGDWGKTAARAIVGSRAVDGVFDIVGRLLSSFVVL